MKMYTLCFIQRNNDILLLNRKKIPNQGLWNGVGGKLEEGETPISCAIREIKEETGLILTDEQVLDKGLVHWIVNGEFSGGLHIFYVRLGDAFIYPTPMAIEEGILDWKSIDWITAKDNLGMAELVPLMIRRLTTDPNRYFYQSSYEDNKLIDIYYEKMNS